MTDNMLLLLFIILVFPDTLNNAIIKGVAHPETLQELSDQASVVEGDIILSNDRNAVGTPWPTTDIPYEISPGMESRTSDILTAMAMLSEHTCITFHKRNDEPNYVLFQTGNGCASYVGFVGGGQGLFVAPPCSSGNIAHELLHTIGFQHEHTRTDRDQYIKVVESNIIQGFPVLVACLSGEEKNFKKLNGQTFGIPYDYTSIMHYGSNYFSSNGQNTIIPKHGNVHGMGQRKKLMKSDIEAVRFLYECDALKSNGTANS